MCCFWKLGASTTQRMTGDNVDGEESLGVSDGIEILAGNTRVSMQVTGTAHSETGA